MPASDSLDRTGTLVAVAVFVALVVDGMDLQMLALALPSISKELQISSVSAGALSTYTLIGMGVGGVLAGWLADRIGRVRVVWWWLAASSYSIGLGIDLLGISYAVCALVPGLFIREKMFDPRAIEPPAAAARLEPAGLDATP